MEGETHLTEFVSTNYLLRWIKRDRSIYQDESISRILLLEEPGGRYSPRSSRVNSILLRIRRKHPYTRRREPRSNDHPSYECDEHHHKQIPISVQTVQKKTKRLLMNDQVVLIGKKFPWRRKPSIKNWPTRITANPLTYTSLTWGQTAKSYKRLLQLQGNLWFWHTLEASWFAIGLTPPTETIKSRARLAYAYHPYQHLRELLGNDSRVIERCKWPRNLTLQDDDQPDPCGNWIDN